MDPAGNATVIEHLNTGGLGGHADALGVVRLTPTGTVSGGAVPVITALPSLVVDAVTTDSHGRTVIVGQAGAADAGVFVMRLAADGSLDSSFGEGGIFTYLRNSIPGAVDTDKAGNVFFTMAVPGKILVAKLTTAGALDPSFGTDGLYTLPIYSAPNSMFDGYATIRGLAVEPNGHVLVGATVVRPETAADFAVLRLTDAGVLDTAFNPDGPTPGVNEFDFGNSDYDIVRWMDLTPTGQILVGGFTGYFSTPIAKVARLNGTGDEVQLPIPPIMYDPGPVPPITVAPTNPFVALGVPVRTATGDVNGDGVLDTIFVTGPGTPLQVAVVSGADGSLLVAPFTPFGTDFTGGGFVAAGDFNGDGRAEFVITPDVGGGPRAVVYSVHDGQAVPLKSFFGIDDDRFRGGIHVAVGDLNGDGTPDLIVAAGEGGGPRVAVYDGKSLLTEPARLVDDFFAMPGGLVNGVYVGTFDWDGDGRQDIVFGAGPGGAPRVQIINAKLLLTEGPAAALQAPLQDGFVLNDTTSRSGARIVVENAAVPDDMPAGAAAPQVYSIAHAPGRSDLFTSTRLGLGSSDLIDTQTPIVD